MEIQHNGVGAAKLSVRETRYPGGRAQLEGFLLLDGMVIATCALDCTTEPIGIRCLEAFAAVLRQRASGLTIVPPGAKVD